MRPLIQIDRTITSKTELLLNLSDRIWRLAELPYEEFESAALLQ